MRITQMVAWKLISKAMFPTGLYRSLFTQPLRSQPDLPSDES
jgi:hypothetical protein